MVKLTTAVNDHYRFPFEEGNEHGAVVENITGKGWTLATGIKLMPGDLITGVLEKSNTLGGRDPRAFVGAVLAYAEESSSMDIPIVISRITDEGLQRTTATWKLTKENVKALQKLTID